MTNKIIWGLIVLAVLGAVFNRPNEIDKCTAAWMHDRHMDEAQARYICLKAAQGRE